MVMFLNPGAEHYAQPQAEQLYKDVVDRVRQLPMVDGASVADTPPFSGGLARTTFTDGVDVTDPRNGKLTPIIAVAPGYFSTAGITMLRGRDFGEHDDAQGAMVGIVNTAMTQANVAERGPGRQAHALSGRDVGRDGRSPRSIPSSIRRWESRRRPSSIFR